MRVFKNISDAAGLKGAISTHSLRKTFAWTIYRSTKDILLVRDLLGHSSVRTTQAYLGPDPAAVKVAEEAIEDMLRGR